jgi:hypothetical protein
MIVPIQTNGKSVKGIKGIGTGEYKSSGLRAIKSANLTTRVRKMKNKPILACFALTIFVCSALLAVGPSALPQHIKKPSKPTSPLTNSIFGRSVDELCRAALTLDYIGTQSAPVTYPLGFSTDGYSPDLKLFGDIGQFYPGWTWGRYSTNRHLFVTATEFRRILDAIHLFAQKPRLLGAERIHSTDSPLVSCSLYRESGNMCEGFTFEVIQSDYAQFYRAIIGALDLNDDLRKIVAHQSRLSRKELKE